MKILLLCWRDTGHPEGGGSERYLERVGAYLAEQGHEVTFRTAAYPGVKKKTLRDGMTFSRAGGNFSVYVRAWLYMLAKRVTGRKPDVVIDTQNGVPFFAKLFSGAPAILLTHHCHREQWPVAGPAVGRLGWFIESQISPRVHRHCRYITVSAPSADDLVDLGIDRDRITIIRNGVDPIPPTLTSLHQDTDEPHLVTLSRLVPHKQIEHAIDTLAAISDEFPTAVLDIIGSGWWSEELAEYAQRRGLTSRIIFHGQVSEEEKHRILARASVHLMPSRKEGWGLAVIESAQHGVPTIGYRSSAGLKDSVVDGVTGVLVDTQTELAAATRALLHDATSMSADCTSRAEEFGWATTAQAVERVIDDVTS